MIASKRDAIASPHPPTSAEFKRVAAGDQQSCHGLIERWETPVKIIAAGYASRKSDVDDLRQVGRLALYQCRRVGCAHHS